MVDLRRSRMVGKSEASRRPRRRLFRALGAGWLLACCVVASIAATSAGAGGASESTAAGKTATRTLNIWYGDGDDLQKIVPELTKVFEKRHPDVKVKVTYLSSTAIAARGRLSLGTNNPPDVLQLYVNYPLVEPLVAKGLLLDLEKYARKYGWRKRFPITTLELSTSHNPKTGKVGKGHIYGLWQAASPLVVYYNKAELKKLGASVPTTFQQFGAILPKAKAAGLIPFTVGNVDKWPALHYWYEVADQYISKKAMRDILARKPGAQFKSSGMVASAAKIQEWSKAGYFNDDFNGIGYDDSIRQFGQGNALFYVAGTWASNTFYDAMKGNVGVFFMPPRKGQPLVVTSSGNWPEYVSGKTKYPDLAAEWVELTSGELAGRLLAAKGTVPGFTMKKLPAASNPLYAAIFKLAGEMSRKDAVVTYMDAGSTGILDPMQSGLQDLMADRVTPTKFVDSLDKYYRKNP
jgi:raffinose/stachyose/melibiose transport system substrate-binding protein